MTTSAMTEKLPGPHGAGVEPDYPDSSAADTVILNRDGTGAEEHVIETKFGIEEEAVSTAHSLRSVPIDKEPEDAVDYPDGGYGWVCCICAFMVSNDDLLASSDCPRFRARAGPCGIPSSSFHHANTQRSSTLLHGASTLRSASTSPSTLRATASPGPRTSTLPSSVRSRSRLRSPSRRSRTTSPSRSTGATL